MSDEQTLQGADYLYKSLNAQFNIDEAEGIVEAFAAGIGNKDSVGDICLPGCFASSLKRRKPRVVWGHNWNEPIGKVLEIYEVGPNDPRLPAKMRKAGIGGLYVRVQFNLKSERGKEAFANVSFFGLEQEWSIGYKTLDAVFDPVQGANLLKEVELYEVSPVLHGANQLTGTISIKADEAETLNKDDVQIKREVLRDPKGGLTAAGRRHFKRTEGANLKPGVKGPADTPEKMRRKGSFLTRFFTNPSGPMKKPNGKPTRLALSAAAWGEPVPQNAEDAAKLAAKGRRLLERYENSKKKKKDDNDSTETKNHVAAIYEAYNSSQNEAFGRASQLTRALATRFGGPVRLVTADNDIAIFEMGAGTSTEMMRVAYHYDGDEFMFGTAQQVKPETVYIPTNDSTGSRVNPPAPQNQIAVGVEQKPMGGHCCPGCAGGKGNCDATVSLQANEDPKIAFVKLKSLGDQLGFGVVPTRDGFVLEGFGNLTVEAQNFVATKIEGSEKKALTPIGRLAADMNPLTARDADQDRLVLEGIPTINLGRGVPDPTPFGFPRGMRDIDGDGMVMDGAPQATARRAARMKPSVNRDGVRMMPGMPDPDREVPDVIPEKPKVPVPEKQPVERPEREKVKPRTPSRPVREPSREPSRPTREPSREPVTEPVPVPPVREPVPVPVPARPERVPQRATRQITEPMAAMTMNRGVPDDVRRALQDIDLSPLTGRQDRRERLRDSGYDEMRKLMSLDDENKPAPSSVDPTASMSRMDKDEVGRKIWLARTHDNASLEQMASRYRISRQEARQLELRHARKIRQMDENGANRVGRAMIDDAASTLSTEEADLLKRRFDGELLEESASRLGMDRFAVRRMEQLALAKLRDAMVADEPTASMGLRRRNQAAGTVRRPKGEISPLTGRAKRDRLDPTIAQMVDSLRDTGPDGLSDSQLLRIATMMRLRRLISNKIDKAMASGASRRLANMAQDVEKLNDAHVGPFKSAREAATLAVGNASDFANSVVKMANNDHDPLDLDSSVNSIVFNTVVRKAGDIKEAARSMGMDPKIVMSRYNAHALKVLASSTPAKEMVRSALNDNGDLLNDAETEIVSSWLNGMGEADTAELVGLGISPSDIVQRRASALRKLGIDVGSPMMRERITTGRIFYNENGLYSELTSDSGAKIVNRIGDGPVASMADSASKRVITADIGDGPREYIVARSTRNEMGEGERVSLVRLSGDDEQSVSSLVGRQILNGDERGGIKGITATLRSVGQAEEIITDDGRRSPIVSSRRLDDSLLTTPRREALRQSERLLQVVSEARTKKMDKASVDVDVSERRVSGLEQALRHFDETGEWIGGDLGVTTHFADYTDDFVFENGLDTPSALENRRKDENGNWTGDVNIPQPRNRSADEVDDIFAENAKRDNPSATEDEIALSVREQRDKFRQRLIRKIDLAKKEAEMRRYMAETKQTRISQNSIDLEDVPAEVADMLASETRHISGLKDPSSVFYADTDSPIAYVAHKGTHVLDGGVLDPAKSQGVVGSRVSVAGNTALINARSADYFAAETRQKRTRYNGLLKLQKFFASGDRSVVLDDESRYALKLLDDRLMPSDGIFDMDRLERMYPGIRLDRLADQINDTLPASEKELRRREKALASLERSGGNYLSAEMTVWEAIRNTGGYYARYASADIPENVEVNPPEWRQTNYGESRKIVDDIMSQWWNRLATRGGTWLVAGEKDADISFGAVGSSSEIQILSPLKPLVGISTRWGMRADNSREARLYAALGPAIFARAVKQHKRDGRVDVDTLLTDPDLAPDGFIYDGPTASMGLSPADELASELATEVTEEDWDRWEAEARALSRERFLADPAYRERMRRLLGFDPLDLGTANQPRIARPLPVIRRTRRTRAGRLRGDLGFEEDVDPSARRNFWVDGPTASMSADDNKPMLTEKGKDLVDRSDRFYPIDNNRLIDGSRMSVSEQDEMFDIADKVRYGLPTTPEEMTRLEMLVRKAERINAPSLRLKRNPHQFDEVVVDEVAAGGNIHKMRWKHVDPETGDETLYEIRRVGLDHPAAKLYYVRVQPDRYAPSGERYRAWNHPDNDPQDNAPGDVINWPVVPDVDPLTKKKIMRDTVGSDFNQDTADVGFQRSRTFALDQALGIADTYPKPWEIEHRIRSAIGMSIPLNRYKADHVARGYYGGLPEGGWNPYMPGKIVETDDSVGYFGLASFDDVKEMVRMANASNKPVLLDTYGGADAGDSIAPSSRYLTISGPELVFGKLKYSFDENRSTFIPLSSDSQERGASLHILGTDESGADLAIPLSNIVMSREPKRQQRQERPDVDDMVEPTRAFDVKRASADDDGLVTVRSSDSAAIIAAAYQAQGLSADDGMPYDLVFAYPSSVFGQPGKRLKDRRLRDVEVIDGVWDDQTKSIRRALPDDENTRKYVVGTEIIENENGETTIGLPKTFNVERMKASTSTPTDARRRESASDTGRSYDAPRSDETRSETLFDSPTEAGSETAESSTYPHDSLVGTDARPVPAADAARALDREDPEAIKARQRDERNMWARWKLDRPGRRPKFPSRRNWKYEIDENGRRVPVYPFRKSWRPWGGAIKSALDGIKTWSQLRDFLNTGTFYVLDWETTGIVAGKARDLGDPVQVAVVKVVDGKVADRFSRWMRPTKKLSQWAKENLRKDGVLLTDETAAQLDDPEKVLGELAEFMGDKPILIAHNMENFDLRVLREAMPDFEIGGWIDTLAIANGIFEVDMNRMRKLSNDRHPDWFDMVKWVAKPKYGARFWKKYTGPLKKIQKVSKRTGKPYPDGVPSTSLEALAAYFGIRADGAHDAANDTVTTVQVLGKMIDLADRWNADPEMFDPDIVDWRDKDESEVHAAAVIEWETRLREATGQRETLFGDDDTGSRPGGETSEPRPGPSSARRERETSFDPNRRVLQTLPNGVAVVESVKAGVYFELPDAFSIGVPENAASVLGMIKQGQDGGYGISFIYGTTDGGLPRRHKLFSLEVVPKRGLSIEQAKSRGMAGYELHGIDPDDGRQKSFDMDLINVQSDASPNVSDIQLPLRNEPQAPTFGGPVTKLTTHQYSDYVRRARARSMSAHEPSGSMAGLSGRDGVSDPFSYWTYGDNDSVFSDMSNEQVAMMAREARRRFDVAFMAGPRRNNDALNNLNAIAAANRILRVRSANALDDSGLSVSMDGESYKLSGQVDLPSFAISGDYMLPLFGPTRRAEMAKNATLSSSLNSVIASNRRGVAVRSLSRITGIPENQLRSRLVSHDYETYRNAVSDERFAELASRIADGSITPNSMGFIIPEDADIRTAARAMNNFGRVAGLDDFGPTAAMSSRTDYSNMDSQTLIREFNDAVEELFTFGQRYESAEFKVKARALRERISNISSEMRRRFFDSEEGREAIRSIVSEGPTASMATSDPDFPVISGSSWLDARLFEIYGEEQYEKVARNIGRRFDDIAARDWVNPTDDDLVDLYHYASLLTHDELVEMAVRSGDFIGDAYNAARGSEYDSVGATGAILRLSSITGVAPERVSDLILRGRDTAAVRRLAAMDPFSRVEEMAMVRRRNAFRRLIEAKKRELGEAFPQWLAEATMRNEDMLTGSDGKPLDPAIVESIGGRYVGFFGETPAEAMDRMREYYGDGPSPEPTASMANRKFIPPRYDIKPHEGGWVIIDTANRNAISSRVFRDRLVALRGAKKMDRGDRSFNPFSPDDPSASMSARLPGSLRIGNDEAKRFGARVNRDQVATAIDNYRNGRASLPYPSADYATSHQLMEGWVTADASLDTILGRLEYMAEMADNGDTAMDERAREIQSLTNHLYKLQKRRNYFYNQLRERMSREDPGMADMLESWNSTRSGKTRESSIIGDGGLPQYNLPRNLNNPGYGGTAGNGKRIGSSSWGDDDDSRNFQSFVSDFVSYYERAATPLNAQQFTSLATAAEKINGLVNTATNSYVKNKQIRPLVKQAVKVLGLAYELKLGLPIGVPKLVAGSGGGPGGLDMIDSLIDSGAVDAMRSGGPRAAAAFLVNAVSMGLISMERARQILGTATSDAKAPTDGGINRLEESRLRNGMSRVISSVPFGRRGTKSLKPSSGARIAPKLSDDQFRTMVDELLASIK